MRNFKKALIILTLVFSLMGFLMPADLILAVPICPPGTTGPICTDTGNIDSILEVVVKTLLFFIGAVSVVVIIIAGIRMVTSGGNSDSVSKARNSILYASIGVVIAIAAYAIVDFVLFSTTV